MVVTLNRKSDEAGIRMLGGREIIPDHVLATPENADFLRHKVRDMTEKVNAAMVRYDQPFVFTHNALDMLDDWDVCTEHGRKMYLEMRRWGQNPPLMTPLMAEVGALGLSTFRSKVRGTEVGAMNWKKPEQGGKSRDSNQNNILICSANWIESGRLQDTRPLVILTAESDLENQMKREWTILRGFMGLMEINHNGLSVPLMSFFQRWYDINNELSAFWIRRTGGVSKKNLFLEKLAVALAQDSLLLISVDEADKGIGPTSVIVNWFKEKIPGTDLCLYDCLRSNGRIQNFKLANYSATLDAFLQIRHTVNVPVPTELDYTNWRDVPRYTLDQYAEKYKVPELTRLGDTCSPQHNPYGDSPGCLRRYIRINYIINDDVVRRRKYGEEPYKFSRDELAELEQNPDIQGDWHKFKTKEAPSWFAKFFRKRLIENNPDRKLGLALRYTLNNTLNMRLVQSLRKIISEKEMIFIPIASQHNDTFLNLEGNAETVNWKKGKDISGAIREAYQMRGIPYLSVPYILMISGTARRGSKLLNDTVHVEFTNDPTTETSMSQACGRAGGYKDNTELVVTTSHMEVIDGERKKPYSAYTRGSRGRQRTMITLERRKSRFLDSQYKWIDKNIINQPYQLEQLQTAYRRNKDKKGKLKGGWSLVNYVGRKPHSTKVANIAEVITPEVMTWIEENHGSLFHDDQNRPEFVSISLLRMDPDKLEQPKSNIKSKEWHDPLDSSKKSDKLKNEEYMACQLPTGEIYFPVGFRNASDNIHLTLNTQERRTPYLQTIQVLYDYDGRTNRMKCVALTFRLSDYPVVARCNTPLENTHPFLIAPDDQQKEWK